MSSRYKHVSAREGIQQLLAELRSGDEPLKSRRLLLYVLSNKWFHLIDPGFDPPLFVLVRSCNDFTFGYTTSGGDPAFDHHVEVVLDHKNELRFLENGYLLTSRELIIKMVE
jgi:hypothetical protein